jgi:hypothetical protein
MKPLEQLTRRATFRTPIIATAGMVILALSSAAERPSAFGTAAASREGAPPDTAARAEHSPTAIRPFRVSVPESELVELRRRIAATRWPEKETVTDQSQGVPLATIRELARYWASDDNWRAA